jgi:hypothetical protein
MHDLEFSNAQALGALDSTGIVSTHVFDMELEKSGGNTIIENDQIVAIVNITIPPLSGQVAGDEGMDIDLLSNDNADMTTGTEVKLGTVHVSVAELVAGCVKNIEGISSLTQKFVGLWYKATSTTLTTGQTADAHFSIAPLTENDAIQKVPVART